MGTQLAWSQAVAVLLGIAWKATSVECTGPCGCNTFVTKPWGSLRQRVTVSVPAGPLRKALKSWESCVLGATKARFGCWSRSLVLPCFEASFSPVVDKIFDWANFWECYRPKRNTPVTWLGLPQVDD